MEQTAVFTICAKNYLHFAITLHQSVKKHHPDWDLFLCLVDHQGGIESLEPDFEVFQAFELQIPNKNHFFFQYNLLELSTAVKPWAFQHLVNKGYSRVVYLDPDIYVYSPMSELIEAYDSGAGIIFTPHLTGELDGQHYPDEVAILKSGTWNLGFCAIDNSLQSREFINWWQEKLSLHCIEDADAGLFVDQKWCELVPGRFSNFAPLRHEGYNLAYWNLSHRTLRSEGGVPTVNNKPLRFFHFSGFSPEQPFYLSKHQNRYTLRDLPELEPIALDYARSLFENGFEHFPQFSNCFSVFNSGQIIQKELRRIFLHARLDNAPLLPDDVNPFESIEFFGNTSIGIHPSLTYSYLMHALWLSRVDLQNSYPEACGNQQLLFTEWLVENGTAEQALPEQFLERSRVELENLYKHHEYIRQKQLENIEQSKFGKRLSRLASRIADNFRGKGTPKENNVVEFPNSLANLSGVADSQRSFGVNLHGYIYSELGLGQSIRNCQKSLLAAEIPFSISNISSHSFSRNADFSVNDFDTDLRKYGINLFHVNADSTNGTIEALDQDIWRNSINIGFWHWELPILPSKFSEQFKYLDEVWTCSQFVADAISCCSDIPVRIIPHAVTIPENIAANRELFSLPDNKFLFLVMFDMLSYQARKNPFSAIRAFAELIQSADIDAGIVVKVMNSYYDFRGLLDLEKALKSIPNSYLIDQTLDRNDSYALQNSCDCYLSLHRSEGFGFCLAESMALGKPVIATRWSGNLAFMNDENSCLVDYELIPVGQQYGPYDPDQVWADADITQAKDYMRRLVLDEAYRNQIGRNARNYIEKNHSTEAIGLSYEKELRRVYALNGTPELKVEFG